MHLGLQSFRPRLLLRSVPGRAPSLPETQSANVGGLRRLGFQRQDRGAEIHQTGIAYPLRTSVYRAGDYARLYRFPAWVPMKPRDTGRLDIRNGGSSRSPSR